MTDRLTRLNAALDGRYRIERLLGEGGMAAVYLARDVRHERQVALKVLKQELAAVLGAERFLAEIRTTAGLQHPHILPLFDSGEAGGFVYYVMPYIDGESLRDRLDREGQLPVAEAVEIAVKVAGALHHAHGHGVIHRDVKPANILLAGGEPLIADFGIALAVSRAGGGRLTETGLSLGTPYYMSPEQASAERDPSPASDVYSLACVLYEALAGEPPHVGPTAQAVLARILTAEPKPLLEQRQTTPPHVAAAVHRALSRLPADRFSSARDFAQALSEESPPIQPSRVGEPGGPRRRTALIGSWALTGVLVLALAWALIRSGPPSPVERWSIVLPESAPLEFVGEASAGIGRRALDVSRDGRTIVYVGASGGTTRLFVRPADADSVRSLPGTEGAWAPFLSPDGHSVAFFVGDQLLRMDLNARAPTVLADVGDASTGSWSDDGRIAVGYNDGSKLLIVDVASGTKDVLASRGEDPAWPTGSRWILMQCVANPWHVCAFSPERRTFVFLNRSGPPSENQSPDNIIGSDPTPVGKGLLLYTTPGNVVMAVGFDPRTLTTKGPHVEVLRGVRREGIMSSQVQMAVSAQGKLVFASGQDANVTQLVWAGRNGSERPTGFRPAQYGPFAMSPDRKRVVIVATSSGGTPELRVLDVRRGTEQVWSGAWTPSEVYTWDPDSRHFYATFVDDKIRLARVDANVMTGGEVLYQGDHLGIVESIFPDGRLAVNWLDTRYMSLVTAEELAAATGPTPPMFPEERGAQLFPTVSPRGDWLAYTSAASGRYEIVARRYPQMDRRTQISFDGGELPRWAPDGSGLYYRDGRRLYWVALTNSRDQPFADPVLFTTGNYSNVAGPELAVSAKGDELLALKDPGAGTTRELHVVTHWLTEVRSRLHGGR